MDERQKASQRGKWEELVCTVKRQRDWLHSFSFIFTVQSLCMFPFSALPTNNNILSRNMQSWQHTTFCPAKLDNDVQWSLVYFCHIINTICISVISSKWKWSLWVRNGNGLHYWRRIILIKSSIQIHYFKYAKSHHDTVTFSDLKHNILCKIILFNSCFNKWSLPVHSLEVRKKSWSESMALWSSCADNEKRWQMEAWKAHVYPVFQKDVLSHLQTYAVRTFLGKLFCIIRFNLADLTYNVKGVMDNWRKAFYVSQEIILHSNIFSNTDINRMHMWRPVDVILLAVYLLKYIHKRFIITF